MVRRSKKHQKFINKRNFRFFRILQKLHSSYEDVTSDNKISLSQFLLSPVDRITHVNIKDSKNNIVEVVNVSYDIYINGEWMTIIRFDSHHKFLHRHTRVSLYSSEEIEDTAGLIKEGNPNLWYTWVIKHIQSNFILYRSQFTERSSIENLGY